MSSRTPINTPRTSVGTRRGQANFGRHGYQTDQSSNPLLHNCTWILEDYSADETTSPTAATANPGTFPSTEPDPCCGHGGLRTAIWAGAESSALHQEHCTQSIVAIVRVVGAELQARRLRRSSRLQTVSCSSFCSFSRRRVALRGISLNYTRIGVSSRRGYERVVIFSETSLIDYAHIFVPVLGDICADGIDRVGLNVPSTVEGIGVFRRR